MRRRTFLGLSVMAAGAPLLGGCLGNSGGSKPAFYRSLAHSGAQLDTASARDMINAYRKRNGLNPVALDARLETTAKGYAGKLAGSSFNNSALKPDGNTKARLLSAGYRESLAAESVSAGYYTMAEAFLCWRESKVHRETMLLEGAQHMGIATAYARGSKYKVYWVLVMAAPGTETAQS